MNNKAPIYQILLGTLVLMLCITSIGTAHLYSKNEVVHEELNKKRLAEEFLLSSNLQFEREANKICQSYDNLAKENIALRAQLNSKSVPKKHTSQISKKKD